MRDFFRAGLPSLPTEGLYLLAKDAQDRIGSFVADGDSNDPYVTKQRKYLSLIQEELEKRAKG